MKSLHRTAFALAGTLWLATSGTGLASEPVPFVGCAGDGQTGRLAPETGTAAKVDIGRDEAAALAFYVGRPGGVLAPRGWHCFYWYGSNGAFLTVAPTRRIEDLNAFPLDGPAVVLMTRYGGTSGRFEVAQYAARLFAEAERDFIEQVVDEGLVPRAEFPFGPFPDDKLTYRNPRDARFETPAGRDGIGTLGILAKTSWPVYGRVVLRGSDDEPDLWVLKMRLPPGLLHLKSAILAGTTPAPED